jgi:prepilin-type N-terminal cleavage/methylation domain-containing protein
VGRRLSRRTPPRGGFTLIEMMAVVALIALMFLLVVPETSLSSHRQLESAAEAVVAELELARERAIATGTPHRLTLDLDAGTFQMERFEFPPPAAEPAPERDPREPLSLSPPRPEQGRFEPLPDGDGRLPGPVRLERVETPDGPVEAGAVGVEFARDGTATPAVLWLANDAGSSLALEILPLADAVRIRAPE